MRTTPLALGLAAACSLPATASAYTYQSIYGRGCHEQLTSRALREARQARPVLAGVTLSADERALADDLPFSLDDDMRDPGAVALLLAVRDVDLKGRSPTELSQLAEVHGNPDRQHEHCLRARGDDGPEGTPKTIARCRGFIEARVAEAIKSLDATGAIDHGVRVPFTAALPLRGRVTLQLPSYHVHMGEALHALQDGFSHTFRTADSRRVTVALNWIDFVEGDHDEARDGPLHLRELDECEREDALLQARLSLAGVASREIIEASVSEGTHEERMARVSVVLDRYLQTEPGCTADNRWCNAPELVYAPPESCACQLGQRHGHRLLALLCLAPLALVLRRRSRAAALSLAVAIAPRDALADDPSRLRLRGAISASADHPAGAAALAVRYRASEALSLGLDGEWNPWASLSPTVIRPGALNAYATAVVHLPIESSRFDLRTMAHLGTSTILFDLYGVPSGTTGLFMGVNLLGLGVRLPKGAWFVLDPAHVVLPIPQLKGAPFAYVQYRLTLGLEVEL